MTATLELVELLKENDDKPFIHNGVTWENLDAGETYNARLRAVAPMTMFDDPSARAALRELLVDTLETWFSDETNDDACRITVTETSAHFTSHGLPDYAFGSTVVFEGHIEDYLS